jgi:hypothetical protein
VEVRVRVSVIVKVTSVVVTSVETGMANTVPEMYDQPMLFHTDGIEAGLLVK